MNDIQKNNLFYVCSLIEFIGRKTKNREYYCKNTWKEGDRETVRTC